MNAPTHVGAIVDPAYWVSLVTASNPAAGIASVVLKTGGKLQVLCSGHVVIFSPAPLSEKESE